MKNKTALDELREWVEDNVTLFESGYGLSHEDLQKKIAELRATTEREHLIELRILTYPWRFDFPEKTREVAEAWYNETYGTNEQ